MATKIERRVVEAVHRGWIGLDALLMPVVTMDAPGELDDGLRAALQTTAGKLAAQRALGLEIVTVDDGLRSHARDLAVLLSLVGCDELEAPKVLVEKARALVDQWQPAAGGAPAWAFALAGIFACAPSWPGPPDARHVLALLRARVPEGSIPAAMLRPTEAMLRKAQRAITARSAVENRRDAAGSFVDVRERTLRITNRKAGGVGGAVSPWGAAVLFAQAFGIRDLPPKASAARRVRKTKRTTKPR